MVLLDVYDTGLHRDPYACLNYMYIGKLNLKKLYAILGPVV